MSKSPNNLSDWTPVKATRAGRNKDGQRDVSFAFTNDQDHKTYIVSTRAIAEHAAKKIVQDNKNDSDEVARQVKIALEGHAGEQAVAKLITTSKPVKEAISNVDMATPTGLEDQFDAFLRSERGIKVLSEVVPKTNGGLFTALSAGGFQLGNVLDLPTAAQPNNISPKNDEDNIDVAVELTSSSDDCDDVSPNKKARTTKGYVKVNSEAVYYEIINLPDLLKLPAKDRVPIDDFVHACATRDITLAEQVQEKGHDVNSSPYNKLEFFFACLEWHQSRGRLPSVDRDLCTKYYARQWIHANPEVIDSVPDAKIRISAHNYTSTKTRMTHSYRNQFKDAFKQTAAIHDKRQQDQK